MPSAFLWHLRNIRYRIRTAGVRLELEISAHFHALARLIIFLPTGMQSVSRSRNIGNAPTHATNCMREGEVVGELGCCRVKKPPTPNIFRPEKEQ